MIITLLTDFGTRDYFVGSLKGVILGIDPGATIVDISHEVAPQNIMEAAFLLKSTYRYFPSNTLHMVVVDPGVGSRRRPLVATTPDYTFIAPDNGVLSWIFKEERSIEVREITATEHFLSLSGRTFHGRDVFAPIAARISRGTPIRDLGRPVSDYTTLALPRPVTVHERETLGAVLYVDRFGNLISDFEVKTQPMLVTRGGEAQIFIGDTVIRGLKSHYAEAERNKPSALVNSCGHLEIFCYGASAAAALGAAQGDEVTIRFP